MEFSDIKQDTPRLVIQYSVEGGQDQFRWGMEGTIPSLTMIGQVARLCVELVSDNPVSAVKYCPQPAVVIAWDEGEEEFGRFVHPGIPVDPLIGMLEVVRQMLTAKLAATGQASRLLGANGQPLPRSIIEGR